MWVSLMHTKWLIFTFITIDSVRHAIRISTINFYDYSQAQLCSQNAGVNVESDRVVQISIQ